MTRRCTRIQVALCVVLAITCGAWAGVRVRVTRNPIMHPHGSDVLSGSSARFLHGVVLQATASLKDEKGAPVSNVSIWKFERNYDGQLDRLCMKVENREFFYQIDEAIFDRLFSWIENGGTAVYTVPMEDVTGAQAAPVDVELRGGGFTEVRQGVAKGHYIASEFADIPRLVEIGHHFDFGVQRFGINPADAAMRLERHNAGVEKRVPPISMDWIVCDLDSKFSGVFQATSPWVEVQGSLYCFYRCAAKQENRVYTTMIKAILCSRDFRKARPEAFAKIAEDQVKLHDEAFAIAQATALLRALKASDQRAWETFEATYFTSEVER